MLLVSHGTRESSWAKSPHSSSRRYGRFAYDSKSLVVAEISHCLIWLDSKLRACDLMQLRVRDVCHGQSMASRALILQQKTSRPVQFEITEPARTAVLAWISHSNLKARIFYPGDFLFPSHIHASPHLSTRRYARIVDSWVLQLGLDPANYGTHTLRRTKATLIYRRTKNLRAVQLLLGHTKLDYLPRRTMSR
jgi:integrase